MLLAVLQPAVLAEAVKILGPDFQEDLASTMYTNNWSVLFVISYVTDRASHGDWQKWRDNGPRPAWGCDGALSSLLSSGKVWFESHQTWDLWHCSFSLSVPVAVPPGWGPFKLLTHRRESVTGLTSALANIPVSKLSCTLAGQAHPCLHLPLSASSCLGFPQLGLQKDGLPA